MVLGIITNSDDRVLPILSDLQTSVTPRRYRPGTKTYFPLWQPSDDNDVQFVTLSYDVGFEKPDRRIFDSAKKVMRAEKDLMCEYIHVGDDLEKDTRGAEAAGWRGLVLDRDDLYKSKGIHRIKNLTEVVDLVLKERIYEQNV